MRNKKIHISAIILFAVMVVMGGIYFFFFYTEEEEELSGVTALRQTKDGLQGYVVSVDRIEEHEEWADGLPPTFPSQQYHVRIKIEVPLEKNFLNIPEGLSEDGSVETYLYMNKETKLRPPDINLDSIKKGQSVVALVSPYPSEQIPHGSFEANRISLY